MTLPIGISMTVYKRLDYTQQVLESLKKSIEYSGYKYLTLYISVDFFDNSIINYIQTIDWIDVKYMINNPPFGCNKNTKNAMLMALSHNDAIIHIEDDTVLSIDAIKFFVEHLTDTNLRDNPNILSIGGYHKTDQLNPEDINKTESHNDFICWGIAFWKHKMNVVLNNWTPLITRTHDYESWDSYLNRIVFKNSSYTQIRPVISRIKNIGSQDGTYTTGAAMMMNMDVEVWHKIYQSTKYTTDDILKNA